MKDELDLLRRFRAQDANVDAASAHAARAQLLTHIGQAGGRASAGRRPGWWGWWRRSRRAFRATRGLIAAGALVGVMVGVGVVFLSLHHRPPRHHSGPISHRGQPPVLRNRAPGRLPRLPGQTLCNADLARPGAVPGLGGPHSGVIIVKTEKIGATNRSPFSLTARGLKPGRYAVWTLQYSGQASTAAPAAGAKPRLLGVISPKVGRAGKLAVAGVIPFDVNGTYMVRVTAEPPGPVTRPGRTVLQGLATL